MEGFLLERPMLGIGNEHDNGAIVVGDVDDGYGLTLVPRSAERVSSWWRKMII